MTQNTNNSQATDKIVDLIGIVVLNGSSSTRTINELRELLPNKASEITEMVRMCDVVIAFPETDEFDEEEELDACRDYRDQTINSVIH
jgi:hypothetical protein